MSMSTYSPTSSPRHSLAARSITPDIIEPTDDFASSGGFNLADELAMAEDSETEEAGFLAPPANRNSSALSDYEGSEYGDIDEDSDGYLSDHIDKEEQLLNALVQEYADGNAKEGAIGQFVEELRGMRGQMEVENHARRLITMQRSLASALDHHLRLLRDIPVLSPVLLQDDTFLVLLTDLTLPVPVPISELLSDSSLDLTGLSDTLAMARQEQLQITRKLRSVKDSWIERKDEWDVLDERMDWLAEHDSVERRAPGSCAREVNCVVQGFGKVLGGMERQIYDLV